MQEHTRTQATRNGPVRYAEFTGLTRDETESLLASHGYQAGSRAVILDDAHAGYAARISATGPTPSPCGRKRRPPYGRTTAATPKTRTHAAMTRWASSPHQLDNCPLRSASSVDSLIPSYGGYDMAGISRQERERKADLERAARAGFPFAVKAMADAEYASYCRWAPGPRMSRQQWDAFMAHDEAFGGPELRAAEKFERDSADDSELSRIESPACDG